MKISDDGDHIYIDYAEGKPYKECESATESSGSIELSKSISFHGLKGKAEIRCKRDQTLFEIRSSTSYMVDIKFFNILMSNSGTVIDDTDESVRTELVFENTLVRNNRNGISTSKSGHCYLKIFNSSFEQNLSGGIYLVCSNVTTHITSSTFRSSAVYLSGVSDKFEVSTQRFEVLCYKTVFDGENIEMCEDDMFSVYGPIASVVNITMIDSEFKNNAGSSCLMGGKSALQINDDQSLPRKTTVIFIKGLLVENNYNGDSAVSLYVSCIPQTSFNVEIRDSIFRNNSKALGTFLEDSHSPFTIFITNNTFVDNFLFKSWSINYAAAVGFSSGKIQVSSCRFLDNKSGANPYMAVVIILDQATVSFVDCYFENRQTTTLSNQLLALGTKKVKFLGKNTFNLMALRKQQTIFTRTPVPMSSAVTITEDFKVSCPPGYNLIPRMKCSKRNNILTCFYMFFECKQCARKMYSLGRGVLSFNESNDIKCQQCPRGGECERGMVTAKPNFWGYKTKNKVNFIQCPPGYCCDTEHCATYHNCHGYRSGTLCGQCPEGMSESLFSTECISDKDCSLNYFFILCIIIVLVLNLLFFLYHKEIVSFLRSFINRLLSFSVDNNHEQRNNARTNDSASIPSGMIKIFFYYYQICDLLSSSVRSPDKGQFIHYFENVISRVMNMILVNLPSFNCPLKSLRAVPKAVLQHSVGYCLLGVLFLLCLTSKLFHITKKKRNANEGTMSLESTTINEHINYASGFTISQRIASAFTYISLLMYASSTKLCLSLLHCVPVGDTRVLLLDGNITCYQTFQYFLLAYFVLSILPFCLVPVLGSYLLKFGQIGVKQFCAACIFPLPFCCFWFYLLLKERCRVNTGEYNRIEENDNASEQGNNEPQRTVSTFAESNESVCKKSDAAAILSVLLGPFSCHEAFMCLPSSQIPWEGFLIFRRLVLITVMTFVYDIQLRLLLALTLCVAILVVHMFVNPFQRKRDNVLESFSLSTHVILCCLILIQGFYYGEDDYSTSNSLSLLNLIANILIVAPLSIVMIVVIFSIIIKLAFSLTLGVSVLIRGRRIEDV